MDLDHDMDMDVDLVPDMPIVAEPDLVCSAKSIHVAHYAN